MEIQSLSELSRKHILELIANGDVPSRVTNRLLLVAIIQTRAQLEIRIENLETKIDNNPSIVMLFKRRPSLFLRYFLYTILIISLLIASIVAKDDILSLFISILGAL